MAKLGHPDGEVNLTKGAGNTGIIQVVSLSGQPLCAAMLKPADLVQCVLLA